MMLQSFRQGLRPALYYVALTALFKDIANIIIHSKRYRSLFIQELQTIENQNPIKLHQLGAEIVSGTRLESIFERNEMLPAFGVVPWKHHIHIITHCKSINEAFYYILNLGEGEKEAIMRCFGEFKEN